MDSSNSSAAYKPYTLVATFVVLSICYFIGAIIYKLHSDPLKHIPGPKLNGLSRIPYIRHALAGTTVDNVTALHARYGHVVRVSPNEVSFSSGATAWPDIYGFRTGNMKGHLSMQKDSVWFAPPARGVPSVIAADDFNHARVRKILSHAFSEKALSKQESLLQRYADQLIDGVKETISRSPGPVDMVAWYNWTTFDIIGDLAFGEPFGCLRDTGNRYLDLVNKSLEAFPVYYTMRYLPWVKRFGSLIVDQSIPAERNNYIEWLASKVSQRINRDTQRPDFMTEILAHNDEKGESMSEDEIISNIQVMVTAGSETTATTLSGVTFLLLKNPTVLQKLVDEVRGRWKSYDEIDLKSVNESPYLIAVLTEALRYFPPVPTGLGRKAPKGGEVVSGVFIPEGTGLLVSSYPTHHTESNFKDPEAFVPERWMGDPRYVDDVRSSCQPFSFGPRVCLGRNLAYAEMRLILAKFIWTFDLELDPQSESWWRNLKVRALWIKPPLMVRLKEAAQD